MPFYAQAHLDELHRYANGIRKISPALLGARVTHLHLATCAKKKKKKKEKVRGGAHIVVELQFNQDQ